MPFSVFPRARVLYMFRILMFSNFILTFPPWSTTYFLIQFGIMYIQFLGEAIYYASMHPVHHLLRCMYSVHQVNIRSIVIHTWCDASKQRQLRFETVNKLNREKYMLAKAIWISIFLDMIYCLSYCCLFQDQGVCVKHVQLVLFSPQRNKCGLACI